MNESTFYHDGYRDSELGLPMSLPDIPVYAMEYIDGYIDAIEDFLREAQ